MSYVDEKGLPVGLLFFCSSLILRRIGESHLSHVTEAAPCLVLSTVFHGDDFALGVNNRFKLAEIHGVRVSGARRLGHLRAHEDAEEPAAGARTVSGACPGGVSA